LSFEVASSREDFFFTLLPFFYQALQAYLTAFHYCFNVRIKSLFLNLAMRAIETTGILNIQGQIIGSHNVRPF